MSNLVMVIIGAQFPSRDTFDQTAIEKIKSFVTASATTAPPTFWETTSVTDRRGAYNIAIIAYWPSCSAFESWKTDTGFETWWQSTDREKDGHGWYQEVLLPSIDRFETVFSNNQVPEGAANMRETISGEMGEHAYWGSMRDRFAAAQDDRLANIGVLQLQAEATDLPTAHIRTARDSECPARRTCASSARVKIGLPRSQPNGNCTSTPCTPS
jgi:hypothetical protein